MLGKRGEEGDGGADPGPETALLPMVQSQSDPCIYTQGQSSAGTLDSAMGGIRGAGKAGVGFGAGCLQSAAATLLCARGAVRCNIQRGSACTWGLLPDYEPKSS